MASESDDDARSFGSEPDLSAMSALRVTTEAGSSAFAHVFDELLEDTPRGFGHDLEAADTARLQAALEGDEALLEVEARKGASAQEAHARDAARQAEAFAQERLALGQALEVRAPPVLVPPLLPSRRSASRRSRPSR